MTLARVRKLVGSFVPQVRLRRMIEADQKLLSLSKPLPRKALQETRVLPNRENLLEELPSGGVAAEIGVAAGTFSRSIVRVNAPKKLYLIDAWHMDHPIYGQPGYEKVKADFASEIAHGQVEVLRGWSSEMLATLNDESLDWIYVDAAHDYESVRKDLQLAHKKVRPGGFICGHDYTRWGRHGKRFGVLEAVNEFVFSEDYNLAFLTVENNYNWSYALKKVP